MNPLRTTRSNPARASHEPRTPSGLPHERAVAGTHAAAGPPSSTNQAGGRAVRDAPKTPPSV